MFGRSTGAVRRGVGAGFSIESLLSNWFSFAGLIATVSVYYLFLLSNGSFQLFAPEMFGRAFDSMLVHLLHGEFTVDREAMSSKFFSEAFVMNGRTYAYFGIFPALLRLLAIPFADVAKVEMARLSCLAAVVIFVALQLRMLLTVHLSLPVRHRAPELLAVLAVATVLSGPQLYILASAWIYHEPVLWSAAMAAGFNLVVARAAFGAGELGGSDLAWLAALAGLSLLTRPSIGVALYLGTALLIVRAAFQWHGPGGDERSVLEKAGGIARALPMAARDWRLLLPTVILGLLGMAVAVVNYGRWGGPLTFADFTHGTYEGFRHNEIAVFRHYGEFNLGRLWSGALYYATGLTWVLKHIPPFKQLLLARYTGIEAPPVVPLLTNPLTVILAGIGVYRVCRRPDLPARGLAILRLALVGHAAAVLLILTAMYLALRYHFDLSPFMTLAALAGYRSVALAAGDASEVWRKRLYCAAIGLCVLGILCSHLVLVLYKIWCLGVPVEVSHALTHLVPFGSRLYPGFN